MEVTRALEGVRATLAVGQNGSLGAKELERLEGLLGEARLSGRIQEVVYKGFTRGGV